MSTPATATAAASRVRAYFERARIIDAIRLRLRRGDPIPPIPDAATAAAAIRAAPSPHAALALFQTIPSPPLPLYHSLAARLASAGLLSSLRSHIASFPTPPAPLDRLRYFSAAGDLAAALAAAADLRAARCSSRGHPCTESYNLILSLHASTGDHVAALAVFDQMIREGALLNSRTYTVVIEHLVWNGFLDAAMEVFCLLPGMRIKRTTKQYNVLAGAFVSCGRLDDVRLLLWEITSDGVLPGREMRAAIAALRDAGYVEGTEDFERELSPDVRIGYAIDDIEQERDTESGGTEEGEDDDNGTKEKGGKEVENREQLKPWLDPSALAKALEGWDEVEVAELEAAALVWTPRLVCKLLRAFKRPETAWRFFGWVACQPGFAHDCHTVARMLAILSRSGRSELAERLLVKTQLEGIVLSFDTVRLTIDFYGLSKKSDAALKVYRNAESLCGELTQHKRTLLFSSLLRTMAKCQRGSEVMNLLDEMLKDQVVPDIQTFTGMLHHFAKNGDLKNVHKLFGMMRQCKLAPDAYTYRVLIRSYCKKGHAVLALRLFENMRSAGMTPDMTTKTVLVKSLWKEGKLREAALVEERCCELDEWLPHTSPGHTWTVSAVDFNKVHEIYSSCFFITSTPDNSCSHKERRNICPQ